MTERTLLIRTGRTIQQDWFDERTGLVREAAFTRRVEVCGVRVGRIFLPSRERRYLPVRGLDPGGG